MSAVQAPTFLCTFYYHWNTFLIYDLIHYMLLPLLRIAAPSPISSFNLSSRRFSSNFARSERKNLQS